MAAVNRFVVRLVHSYSGRGTVLNDAISRLRQAGIENPTREAKLLLGHVLKLSTDEMVWRFDEFPHLELRVVDAFQKLVDRRAQQEPLSYLTGTREFWSLDFRVTSNVLVPRPATETLIETLTELIPDRSQPLRVLDVGVGTGCLLGSILTEYSRATGVGVDISNHAIACANENMHRLGLNQRAAILQSNWLENITGVYDVVTSNPPYITTKEMDGLEPTVKNFEPHLALCGGVDGLDAYRTLGATLGPHLKQNSLVLLEFGYTQASLVKKIFQDSPARLEFLALRQDLEGIPRCLAFKKS